jgi:hypothetical protein
MTLASLSAGMDNGGSFPFPYFISGFILSPVVSIVRKNIIIWNTIQCQIFPIFRYHFCPEFIIINLTVDMIPIVFVSTSLWFGFPEKAFFS